MTLFLCLNAFSSSFVSCSSIVHSHSAWRLKHHQMAIHNEHLHSLASAKDNSLRMAFHVSMIPLSGSFYSSLPVVFRSESNILLGEVLDLTTEMHTLLLLCVFICDRGDFDKQKQYDDAVNSSPSVRNAVSAPACVGEIQPYGVFFTDEALFSCRLCRYG